MEIEKKAFAGEMYHSHDRNSLNRDPPLSALENFVIFSGKPDWLNSFLLMYWQLQPEFLFKKGQLWQIISRVAVGKCSLKCNCFETFYKFPGKPSVVEYFC